jgi:GT2 family glycosyltransferase
MKNMKSSTGHPKVSIIILNWNGLEDTTECLESLKKITYSNYEVVVVDNGSQGNDAQVLRERFGDYIHVIENDRNYGFAEGNNIGMRYALANFNPDYILLLNNDTVVNADFLTELVKAAEGDVKIGIAGPKIYSYAEPDKISFIGGKINWWNVEIPPVNQIDTGQFDELREVDLVIGCALLIKRTLVEEIGLLYPGYFAYYEEAEWCLKCRKAGYRVVYVPTAKLWHKLSSTAGKIDGFSWYYMTRNRFIFMKRNLPKLQFVLSLAYFFLWPFMFTTVFLLIRQKNLGLLKTFYKGIRDGIGSILKA